MAVGENGLMPNIFAFVKYLWKYMNKLMEFHKHNKKGFSQYFNVG